MDTSQEKTTIGLKVDHAVTSAGIAREITKDLEFTEMGNTGYVVAHKRESIIGKSRVRSGVRRKSRTQLPVKRIQASSLTKATVLSLFENGHIVALIIKH